jgi:hypothetical protein
MGMRGYWSLECLAYVHETLTLYDAYSRSGVHDRALQERGQQGFVILRSFLLSAPSFQPEVLSHAGVIIHVVEDGYGSYCAAVR